METKNAEPSQPRCGPPGWPFGERPIADRHSVEQMMLARGGLFELRGGGADAVLGSARAHIDGLIANGLPVASDGRLDPADVVNATVVAGLAGRSDFWRAEVGTGRRLVSTLAGHAGQGAPDLKRLPPKRFDIVFRRTFALDRTKARGPLRLRAPLPIEDEHLTDLQVRLDDGVSASTSIQPGRLELKTDGGATDPVTLGVQFSFTALPQAPHGSAVLPQADREKWLRDWEGMFLLTDKVRTLARRLAHPGREAATVWAFRDYIIDNFRFGVIPYGTFSGHPLDWMLDVGWFDCRLGALLLVALCRACGAPARLVGGYMIWDAPGEHYWMEAWLPDRGWTPIDLLSWMLSAGGEDRAWRTVYDEVLDYRMKTQVLPHVFTGSPGVPFPIDWRLLFRAVPGGAETQVISALDGGLIYSDEIISRSGDANVDS